MQHCAGPSMQRRRCGCVAHEFLLAAALPVMLARCVLVCSTSRGGRMHCKPEESANATLCRSFNAAQCTRPKLQLVFTSTLGLAKVLSPW